MFKRSIGLLCEGVLMVALVCFATVTFADTLAKPEGRIILTVTGNIEHTNGPGTAQFDRSMLESLGTEDLRTSTSWTEGRPVFSGVPMQRIMDAVGAHGTILSARALNDYTIDIPVSDFSKYRVLAALKMDGQYLKIRNGGPIWIVYPRDDFPELQNPYADQKWIWQLVSLEVK